MSTESDGRGGVNVPSALWHRIALCFYGRGPRAWQTEVEHMVELGGAEPGPLRAPVPDVGPSDEIAEDERPTIYEPPSEVRELAAVGTRFVPKGRAAAKEKKE